MSDKKSQINRIPFESLTQVDKWPLPNMDQGSKVVPAAKKGAQAKDRGERIEDVTGTVKHKPLTADHLKQITEEAEKEGYQAGFEKGQAEGLQQGLRQGEKQGKQQAYQETKAVLDDERARLQAIATALMEPMEQQDMAVENLVMDIAVGMAKHILRQQLTVDISGLYKNIHRAIKCLPMGASNIHIFLNPDDLSMVEELFSGTSGDWKFNSDSDLTRGGCRVESKESVVDYSVERRLQDYLDLAMDNGDIENTDLPPPLDVRPRDHQPEDDQAALDNSSVDSASTEADDPEIPSE